MQKNEDSLITNLKKADSFTVQRSWPLYALWKSDLTLAEFKILDFYLSRINSHEPNKRKVIIYKKELEELMGVKINNESLKTRLKHLMSNVVELPDIDNDGGFALLTLFEFSSLKRDEYGEQYIELECTPKAMKYIFNIEHLGYLKYKLRCITSITSRYSYIMFIYLESNRFRGTWEIDLETLKTLLNCHNEKTYDEFKRFNDLILKKTWNELREKTECKFDYEAMKKGRKVVAIRFKVYPVSKLIMDEVNSEIAAISEKINNDDIYIEVNLWQEAVKEFEFNENQLEELFSILSCVPDTLLPYTENMQDYYFRRYHYMAIKAADIKSRKNIKNKFSYLKKMLKQDAGILK